MTKQNIDKDNIKALWKFHKGQILKTKDGHEYTLSSMPTVYGNSRLHKYLKGLNNITLESNDLISLPPIVNCVEKTGFSVTESKTTLQNWPNQGYTKGLYYYEITLKGKKDAFKVEHRKGEKPVSERSRKGDDFMFLNYNGWHLIRLKK